MLCGEWWRGGVNIDAEWEGREDSPPSTPADGGGTSAGDPLSLASWFGVVVEFDAMGKGEESGGWRGSEWSAVHETVGPSSPTAAAWVV